MAPLVIFGLMAVAVLLGRVVFRQMEKRRTIECFATAAAQLDLAFSETVPEELSAVLDELPLFQRGHRRQRSVGPVLVGRLGGREVCVGRVGFVVGRRTAQAGQMMLFAVFRQPTGPSFRVRPVHLADRLVQVVRGSEGVVFDDPDDAAFSRRYVVHGENPPRIRQVLSPAVRELFSALRNWTAEAAAGRLTLARPLLGHDFELTRQGSFRLTRSERMTAATVIAFAAAAEALASRLRESG